MKTIKHLLFIASLIASSFAFSQEFAVEGKISGIQSNGLHSVLITPEIRSLANENLSDIRLFDSKSRETPYFLTNDFKTTSMAFEEYKIISKSTVANKSSSVVFENNSNKNLTEITLAIANSEVEKSYNISGSNDLTEWFGLVNNRLLDDLSDSENTFIYKNIPLPNNKYRYLKIDFNDKKTLPIAILKVGKFSSQTSASALQEIKKEEFKIQEFPKAKKTRITFKFENSQIIDQISFTIKNASLYRRTAKIIVTRTEVYKKRKKNYEENLESFELTSGSTNTFSIATLREKEFYIDIENQDNQPLSISEVKLFQNPIYLVADLNSAENYTLKAGNPNLPEPHYDLSSFQNIISKALPEAQISQIIKLKKAQKLDAKNTAIWSQPWFMWVCIGIAGIIIFYFSLSLIKDMKKN
ncbi:DUF3999 family protein [uncultured Flavobacterium sp.]|uniref:DUF3999 family protein n=1 Tax=uncultured Flavobacterium sp. TaxID=165435 RepID=UPI0025D7F014|nr:DUF3999 family protein [uncultured Flavobacterium sp.]